MRRFFLRLCLHDCLATCFSRRCFRVIAAQRGTRTSEQGTLVAIRLVQGSDGAGTATVSRRSLSKISIMLLLLSIDPTVLVSAWFNY
jgi:hypothetical protein